GKGGKPGMGIPGIPGAGNAIPVYVVNMPGSLGGPSTVPSIPGGAGGVGGAARKLPGFLKGLPWLVLGKAGLSFAGGYAVGSGINWGIDKAVSAATGGQYDAFGALFYDLLHKEAARSGNERKTDVGGEIKITFEGERMVVKDIRSNNPNVDLDVDTGLMMRWQ
ncbi:MAG: hypothetical protein LLF89_08490, partial [Spirochaetaceae bacterium]|nr:hypothetical protein [Spirochaetaceae bacterium]